MKICKVNYCNDKHYSLGYCSKHYRQFKKYGRILKQTRFTPNEIINCGDYYEICLCSFKQKEIARTKIDKDDLEKAKKYKWGLTLNGYAINSTNKLFLHHLLGGTTAKNLCTDHINRDRLDNRKKNLRFVNISENCLNRAYYGKGVYKKMNRWQACIVFQKKNIYLGSFKTEIEAIKIRKQAELKYAK